MIRVLKAGFLTTVQDLGRYGYAHLGVSASGAADALSLRAANLLVGNPEGAAALEMTLVGGSFEFQADTVAALAGADFGAGFPLWTPFELRAGDILRCGATRGGARCYLAVRGGIDVPAVLGSASTHLLTGLGGFEGRALRAGDVLRMGNAAVRPPSRGKRLPPLWPAALRVTAGPQAAWFPDALYRAGYRVTEESDRMGLRLDGPPLERHGGRMLTEGVPLGAVQVPPDGRPIILFVEHQTTGGYPKIASVIAADLPAVGQLRPRDTVGFELVSLETALALAGRQEEWLYSLV
jgi:antagonist of KipI